MLLWKKCHLLVLILFGYTIMRFNIERIRDESSLIAYIRTQKDKTSLRRP